MTVLGFVLAVVSLAWMRRLKHGGLNADVAQNTAALTVGREIRERGSAEHADSDLGRGGSEPPSALSPWMRRLKRNRT